MDDDSGSRVADAAEDPDIGAELPMNCTMPAVAPEATLRETAAPDWLEIDTRHARVMSAVARAASSGWPRRCVKLTKLIQ